MDVYMWTNYSSDACSFIQNNIQFFRDIHTQIIKQDSFSLSTDNCREKKGERSFQFPFSSCCLLSIMSIVLIQSKKKKTLPFTLNFEIICRYLSSQSIIDKKKINLHLKHSLDPSLFVSVRNSNITTLDWRLRFNQEKFLFFLSLSLQQHEKRKREKKD